MYRIYLVLHRDSGRVYIGQTCRSVTKRFEQHAKPATRGCPHLANAIAKYGVGAFTVYELLQVNTQAEANALEIALIEEHDACNPTRGFNIAMGGTGARLPMCSRGHSTSQDGERNEWGNCTQCAGLSRSERRATGPAKRPHKRICSRGHDKYAVGMLDSGQCRECSRMYHKQKWAERATRPYAIRKPTCPAGHDRTDPENLGAYGRCKTCDRLNQRRLRVERQRVAA